MLSAQQFTKITSGDIVNTPGDSRSINLIDVNNDGYDDVFISRGLHPGTTNSLYLNNGNGTFSTVVNDPIVSDSGAFDGATFADADNDGDVDAFVVTWWNEPNFFYRNNGNGSFTAEPQNLTGSTGTYSETAAWGDYENDGYADLYITNSDGIKKNMLFHNNQNGSFTQITTGAVVNDAHASRGCSWSDYDTDGDQDLLVVNESGFLNDFYINDGSGNFTKLNGVPPVNAVKNSMSPSFGDIDNDGDLDLYISNSLYFVPQNNQLFLNNGTGGFTAVTSGDVVNDGGCSYGSAFADYDNDGDLDLFVSNGFCNGTISNFLYENDGAGNFTRELTALPDYTTPCSFGCAWSDLDGNGFQDLVVSTCKNSQSAPLPSNMVFMNNGNGNHYLGVHLTGTISNHSALGALIYLTATINGQTVTQMREISSQTGYCGQNSVTAHFGLGTATQVLNLMVKWPSGNVTQMNNLAVDTVLYLSESLSSISEGSSITDQHGYYVFRDTSAGMVVVTNNKNSHLTIEEISVREITGKIIWRNETAKGSTTIKIPDHYFASVGLYLIEIGDSSGEKIQLKYVSR